MAFVLETFFCCLDLKLGAIIMAWWGMICKILSKIIINYGISLNLLNSIVSAISIVGLVLSLVFNKGHFPTYFPVHLNTGSTVVTGIIALILLCVYFYFSYQLLMGAQSVSKNIF